jgi:hypothetical protein
MVDVCECAANWRIEMVDLLSGEVTHTITPISFEFETAFLEAGRGTITFDARAAERTGGQIIQNLGEISPSQAGIYFARVHGGAATPAEPVNMFGGFIETLQSASDGVITLGFAEMQKYLDYRLIRSDLSWTGVNQNIIPSTLVEYTRGANLSGGTVDPIPGPGIQLFGSAAPGVVLRDRNYIGVERKNIGEAIKEYIQILDGPVYQMSHFRNPTGWRSVMRFSDTVEQFTDIKTVEWSQLTDLSVGLDGNELANVIDAFGDPEEDGTPRIHTAPNPASTFLPRFDAAPTFSGVTNLTTLNQHAFGYQNDHYGTTSDLRLYFSGLEYGQSAGGTSLTLDDFVPGYELALDIRSPYWEIEAGPQFISSYTAHVGRVSVAVGLEGPEQVTVQIVSGDAGPGSPGYISGSGSDCEDCY